MSWLDLDDGILEHPKFVRAIKLAGSEAIHLWLGLRAYCGKHLTDGFVADDMMDEVKGPKDAERRATALAALFEVGLLEKTRRGGLQMHDYLDWSKSREQVLAAREQARARKTKSRGPSGGSHGGGHGSRHGVTTGVTTGGSHGAVGSTGNGVGSLSVPKAETDQSGSAGGLAQRAARILRDPFAGSFEEPSKWPEVVRIADAWSFGSPIRLGNSPGSDSDLRSILEAIAAENPVDELVRAGTLAEKSPYFSKPERRHPGAFTAAVIRRLLGPTIAPAPAAPVGPDPFERAMAVAYPNGIPQ